MYNLTLSVLFFYIYFIGYSGSLMISWYASCTLDYSDYSSVSSRVLWFSRDTLIFYVYPCFFHDTLDYIEYSGFSPDTLIVSTN